MTKIVIHTPNKCETDKQLFESIECLFFYLLATILVTNELKFS
jgi:hypothetical protein